QKCGDAKGGCKDPCQKDGCKDPCQKDGCGAKDGDKGCVQKSCGSSLLERIFARRNCCESKGGKDGKGCDDGKGDEKAADGDKVEPTADAPVPPAPVVDPSAFLKSQRRVITTPDRPFFVALQLGFPQIPVCVLSPAC
ncbi:MAG: hypothetical protein MUE50_15925, partial [Pirellulaceae bacterium]|nr:hypothetical protein [Pirellulaceae bacterium]